MIHSTSSTLVVSLALLTMFASAAIPEDTASQAGPVSGVWLPTGSMTTARQAFTTTLLPDGRVLAAGGCGNPCYPYFASAELYDPSTGVWTPTGSMTTPRTRHMAALLANGKVLVVGGDDGLGIVPDAELYDPSTGKWTSTQSTHLDVAYPLLTSITSGPLAGLVLKAGGEYGPEVPSAKAELYYPAAGTWTVTSSMNRARTFDQGGWVTLPDGSVFVVGGVVCCPYHWLNEAEVFDSATQTWTQTPSKTTTAQEAAALMPSGQVLVAGGASGTQPTNKFVAAAELFTPPTGAWSAAPSMSTDRDQFTLTRLTSGQALAAGGQSGGWGVCHDVSSAELYDPGAGRWLHTGGMTAARYVHTATLLADGRVLVAGGLDCEGRTWSSSELYTETTATLTIDPPSGAPMTKSTITGSGFASNETINIYGSRVTSPIYTVTADGSGAFMLSTNVRQGPYGATTIYAVGQSSGKIGGFLFQITARMAMNPNTGAPGGTTAAQGFGFGAGERVKVYWNNPRQLLGTATANGHGSSTLTITIPTGAPLGANQVFGVGQTTNAVGKGWITVQ